MVMSRWFLISDRHLSYLLFFVLRVGGLGIGGPFFCFVLSANIYCDLDLISCGVRVVGCGTNGRPSQIDKAWRLKGVNQCMPVERGCKGN